jgi:D-glycero-alpha-D-manno-heptose-7-phosphate kinase
MIIRARAPLRLGLAGGGTDVAPYCDVHGGLVLNATIDRYAYAVIKPSEDGNVHFSATDQDVRVSRPVDRPLELDGRLNLHCAVYAEMMQDFNGGKQIPLELITFCDAPVGSGLGSSSTLVVVMIRALAELLNLTLDDYAIARLAFVIERVRCGLKGGRQDQYSATFGGFNYMEFYGDDKAIVNPLRIRSSIICELEASLLLFYTGISRESGRIIDDQSSNVSSGVTDAIEAMHGIKREASVMRECLLRGDFDGLVESMRLGWINKKRSAVSVSNSHLDDIYQVAMAAGSSAGKISGAGGGGFMMLFIPPDKRMNVVRALSAFDGQVSNCHFTKNGAQAWRA